MRGGGILLLPREKWTSWERGGGSGATCVQLMCRVKMPLKCPWVAISCWIIHAHTFLSLLLGVYIYTIRLPIYNLSLRPALQLLINKHKHPQTLARTLVMIIFYLRSIHPRHTMIIFIYTIIAKSLEVWVSTSLVLRKTCSTDLACSFWHLIVIHFKDFQDDIVTRATETRDSWMWRVHSIESWYIWVWSIHPMAI